MEKKVENQMLEMMKQMNDQMENMDKRLEKGFAAVDKRLGDIQTSIKNYNEFLYEGSLY